MFRDTMPGQDREVHETLTWNKENRHIKIRIHTREPGQEGDLLTLRITLEVIVFKTSTNNITSIASAQRGCRSQVNSFLANKVTCAMI